MLELKQILVPTDFSANAQLALQYANSLAKHFGANLHLLHVIPDPVTAMGMYEQIGEAIPEDWQESMLNHSDQQLKNIIDKECDQRSITISATAQGDAFNEISRYAKNNDIDLIVIGMHGRTRAIHHYLIGGLADRIFRKATCPVLTVPAE